MTESLKRLWPFIKTEKRLLRRVLITGALMGPLGMSIPALTNLLYSAFEAKDTAAAAWIPFLFPSVFLVIGSLRYLHASSTKILAERVIASMRRQLIDQFVNLNLSFHNSFSGGSGGLISRVLNDTQVLQDGLYYYVDLYRDPFIIAGVLASMIYMNPGLTLFTLLASPIIIFVMKKVRQSLKKYGQMNRESMDKVTGTLKESLDGVRVIQSFNLEEKMLERFNENQNEYLNTRGKIVRREEAVSPINEFLGSLFVMGLSMYAFRQIFGGHGTAADFTSFLAAAAVIQMPIKRMQTAIVRLQQTVVVVERMFALLESQSRVPQIQEPRHFPKKWDSIRFENVSFTYGAEHVLSGISATVKKGEVIALVGESGSGKSTMVNLLERFFDPSEGQIFIDETPISHFNLKDLRQNIALVTQDVFLFRDTIENNIWSGDFSKPVIGVERAAQLANAHGFIASMPQGFQSNVGERGGFLSGGEKQRVSIARAIFKDAPILILDEATSALDSVSELEVQKGLNHLMEGRTVFVIAHRLSTVLHADRILVMKKGRIVEQGDHETLLKRGGEYANFFKLQMSHGDRAV